VSWRFVVQTVRQTHGKSENNALDFCICGF
jgi:hypothetical protein